ncbi:MAG: hypothetical protein IMY73_00265 [Bacteroidetes bacterium]|nr:hypothetical protein [Bacteroidota bacterium]
MKSKVSKIVKSLLVAFLICYYCGYVSSYHTHIVNGVKITHAHPFSSQNNTHDISTFVLIGAINSVVLVSGFVFILKAVFSFIRRIYFNFQLVFLSCLVKLSIGRSPPCSVNF